jgi:hypothetical protein
MNRDDIIRMAREAGWPDSLIAPVIMAKLAEFAALVAAAEREACAQLAQNRCLADASEKERTAHYTACNNIADDIRARGQA